MEALANDVLFATDDYQWERAARLGVVERTIGYTLKRLAIMLKKILKHPKADKLSRCDFQRRIRAYELEGQPILYLDESDFVCRMP